MPSEKQDDHWSSKQPARRKWNMPTPRKEIIVIFVIIVFILIQFLTSGGSHGSFSLFGSRNCAKDIRYPPVTADEIPSSHNENKNSTFAKIGKITMLYGDPNPVYERALDSHRFHAEVHGYPIFVGRQKMLGRLWTKPAHILSVVLAEMEKPAAERLHWLFWFDADTLLLNPLVPLEVYLPPANLKNIHFLCGNDHNGLNDGAFLLRINDFALHMLAASLSVESFRPEIDMKYSEQSAIEHVVNSNDVYKPWDKTTYYDGFANIPQRWLNAYLGARSPEGELMPKKKKGTNDVLEGDLLLHFVGSGDTKRRRMMTFMDSWEINRDVWEKPLDETHLVKEIEDFWTDFAKKDERRKAKHKEIDDGSSKSSSSSSSSKSDKSDKSDS